MGRKPEAGGAKGKRTDPEQSARFIEATRQAGVDETGEAFERAFDRIAPRQQALAPAGKARRPASKKPARG